VGVVAIEPASTTPLAWDEVVARASPALLRLALMLLGSVHEAEDLLQATFARACRHGDRIASMAAPVAYLRRVMLNEHTSQRRRRKLVTSSWEESVETGSPAGHVLDERDQAWRWLATLPRQQRAVLVLRFYEDLRDHEIADLLGCRPFAPTPHADSQLFAHC